ncbi:CRISPR-associated helicase Cas3' [Halomonas qinghailakensis]|uniref:CRISPR-associated helicase Cas3 n=1 Tax=Halomonas qinghailakensis TaxID=2937790 RepID=A0AA46YSU6_9GAMM|nr:CRISPR-associated helicase Cas3' [Halomonas sp. ZZQ-149]UYO75802.1 CRISPR-associated helicase Cas3' [Halomonas sp. ZZQ-149]
MTYYRYWGKAQAKGQAVECHLLPYHNLDVAAVGWLLLSPDRPLTQRLAAQLSLKPEALRQLLVFWLGLHDIGKFSRAFQGLFTSSANQDLVPPIAQCAYTQRHDRLGAVIWEAKWHEWFEDGTLRWPAGFSRMERKALRAALPVLTPPFFGHHGQPVEAGKVDVEAFFCRDQHADDVEATRQFIADWADIVPPDWPTEQLFSEEWVYALQTLSWSIAGWATLSDWLGSNQDHFAYHQMKMPLTDYWQIALANAERALQETGFKRLPEPLPYAGMASWFGQQTVTPTPLQHAAETVAITDGPQLFILEDETGSGKTEAACILTQRLLAAGHGDGLYFALPTMATSNAMYARLGNLHRRFYTAESMPSFVLAHGARDLNDDFMAAVAAPHPGDLDYTSSELSATSRCNQWLADSRKKALLAEVGVGTIDQALMAILPFRHQSLRLYGLARKVLVIDEVHAYDNYMQTLLSQLLSYHARQGGSAILLTATLPRAMRSDLMAAWQAGLGQSETTPQKDDFPLLTHVSEGQPLELPLGSRKEVARSVEVDWLTEEEQAIDAVLAAIEAGECIAWVRNTVDDAIRAFEAIAARHPDPEHCLLFHSRFAMVDRQRIESQVIERLGKDSTPDMRKGQVLISTQVFQESLDCDVDVMVSDIAPIDLLIQRAGRLQRHQRGLRCPPRLLVLAPPWSDDPDEKWLQRTLPGTQAVYRDTSLSWLTQRVLRHLEAIRLPEEARELIEGVYGRVADVIPDGLQTARYEQKGMQRTAGSMATFNALDLEEGYVKSDQWQEEQEIGTRLMDEPTINVVLLSFSDGDELALWAGEGRHADMLSQVKLRQSQATKLAALPSRYESQWLTLQERYKVLKYTQPWLPNDDPDCGYDTQWGVRLGAKEQTS